MSKTTDRGASQKTDEVRDVARTTCVVVGGGPGGAVLSLLLARAGVSVTLLEAHPDFDREFRGDTIHPSVMEIMDTLGLAERLLELRHTEVRTLTLQTASGPFRPVDFGRLKTKFPYITMMPQTSVLEFITEEANRYPNFRLVMGARVRELVEEDGVIRGILYEGEDGKHEVREILTVGADGRGSRVRRLAGFEPIKTSPPMDVLWFKLPREEGDPEGAVFRFGRGHIAILLDRFDYWQAGYVIPKGTFPELRHEGIEELRRSFAELIPEFADCVEHLKDWRQVSLLSVEPLPAVVPTRTLADRGLRPCDEPGRRGGHQLRYPGRRRDGERARRTAQGMSGATQRFGHQAPGGGATPKGVSDKVDPASSSLDPTADPRPCAPFERPLRAGLAAPVAQRAYPARHPRAHRRFRLLAGARKRHVRLTGSPRRLAKTTGVARSCTNERPHSLHPHTVNALICGVPLKAVHWGGCEGWPFVRQIS
jgi:2-polyprenyl-6-methoxyphenol hydroxylase-like FAD-dependent oxidoreductase